MAYEVLMPYHLHMPSYFLGTFTEYPYLVTYKSRKEKLLKEYEAYKKARSDKNIAPVSPSTHGC